MDRRRMLILVGEENEAKLELLLKLQSKYDLLIPRRITDDKALSGYSSLYEGLTTDEMYDSIKNLRTCSYTEKGIAGIKPTDIGSSIADLYNGEGIAIILNIGISELPFYSQNYAFASFVGIGDKNSGKKDIISSVADLFIDTKTPLDDNLLEDIISLVVPKESIPTLKK